MLKALGLSEHDEAVYCLSLLHPSWSVERLAADLGVRPLQVAECHDHLIARGFLERNPADRRLVVPLPLEAVLDSVLAQEEARAAQRRSEIAQAGATLRGLVGRHTAVSARRAHLEAEYFEGVEAVRLRLEGLAQVTHHEVLSLHPGGAQSPESITASLPLDRHALRRGVMMRAVYLQGAMMDPMTWGYLRQVAAEGARIRIASKLPTRLTLIDRAVAVVPVQEQAPAGSALVIRDTAVIGALTAFFEQSWAAACPLPIRDAQLPVVFEAGEQPSANERTLLRLLSLGLKDEAVARHLGISVRTTRRQIADLLLRLQASSRFQAGIQAARRGWL
jgi:DNA-binding CsgD family transcriptional regulator